MIKELTLLTSDNTGVSPDFNFIGRILKHIRNRRVYIVVGFCWIGDEDIWGFLHEEICEDGTRGITIVRPLSHIEGCTSDGSPRYNPIAFNQDKQALPDFESLQTLPPVCKVCLGIAMIIDGENLEGCPECGERGRDNDIAMNASDLLGNSAIYTDQKQMPEGTITAIPRYVPVKDYIGTEENQLRVWNYLAYDRGGWLRSGQLKHEAIVKSLCKKHPDLKEIPTNELENHVWMFLDHFKFET